MFEKAREFHFPVQKRLLFLIFSSFLLINCLYFLRDVAFSEILNHLEKGLPFLALVNSSWLICPKCLREKKRTREGFIIRIVIFIIIVFFFFFFFFFFLLILFIPFNHLFLSFPQMF